MAALASLAGSHRRRLFEVWRGAGWPFHDPVELDLRAAGLLQRQWDDQGRETLRVTDDGIRLLATARTETWWGAWRGLVLRASLVGESGATQWVTVMPDTFSIHHTTVEDSVEPVVHEIKVSRADLLADLRRVANGQAYQAVAGQCGYGLRAGVAEADELPEHFGVMVDARNGLRISRPAPRRPMRLSLAVWKWTKPAWCGF